MRSWAVVAALLMSAHAEPDDPPAGAPARYETAWSALVDGRTVEAEALLRSAHAADPSHRPAARLVAVLDRLEAPWGEPDLEIVRRGLPGVWKVARGPHVVLLHQHATAAGEARVALMEQVVTSYYLFLAAYGFDLSLPTERLPSAWFARHADYLAYLHAEGADAFRNTRGHYHPTRGLVATYDARDDGRKYERDALLAHNEGTAAHELVHQLVHASGLATRPDALPRWLHEGFAAQFEPFRDGRWAGIGAAGSLRLRDWPRDGRPRLAPLVQDVGLDHGFRGDLYAEAWSLVRFLHQKHPREFVALLDRLRARPQSADSAEDRRLLDEFRAALGDDLEALEAEWLADVAALRRAAGHE